MNEVLENAGTVGMGIHLVFDEAHNEPDELLAKKGDVESLLDGQVVSKFR